MIPEIEGRGKRMGKKQGKVGNTQGQGGDKQGQGGTNNVNIRNQRVQAVTSRDKESSWPCLSLFAPTGSFIYPACPPPCPCLSLLNPALSLDLSGIVGK